MLSSYPLVTIIGFSAISCLYLLLLIVWERNISLLRITLQKFFIPIILLILSFSFITAFSLSGEVGDVRLFATAGYALFHKIDIYWLDQSHGTYPFLPFMIYPYALFWYLSDKLPVFTFSFFIKLLLIPIVFLTSFLIAKILRQKGLAKYKARFIQLLFLTNPIVFLTITFHGQADILLIFFFIASVFYLQKKIILSAVLMALSILTKSWSVIFLPLIILRIRSFQKIIIYLSTFILVLFAFVFLYKSFIFTSITRIFSAAIMRPSGSAGYWGITALLDILNLQKISYFYSANRLYFLFLGILGGLGIYYIRKLSIFRGVLLLVLIVYALTGGWGLQHSLWLVPFGLLNNKFKETSIYSLLTVPYLFLSYLAIAGGWENSLLNKAIVILALFPWGYCCYWLYIETFPKILVVEK